MNVDGDVCRTAQTKCLINIDDWDFNWQGHVPLQRADRRFRPAPSCRSRRIYDNSDGNWRNPNIPPKAVSWGEQTTDEMCIAFLGFTTRQLFTYDQSLPKKSSSARTVGLRERRRSIDVIPQRFQTASHLRAYTSSSLCVRSRERASLRSRSAEEPSARLHRGVHYRAGRARARRLHSQRPGRHRDLAHLRSSAQRRMYALFRRGVEPPHPESDLDRHRHPPRHARRLRHRRHQQSLVHLVPRHRRRRRRSRSASARRTSSASPTPSPTSAC